MSITHDPAARLDYAWDWTAWLEDGETITAHTVTVTAGTATVEATNRAAAGKVTAWVKDAVAGSVRLTCRVTTSAGRMDERSHTLRVSDR